MRKRLPLLIAGCLFILPLPALWAWLWFGEYQESRSDFTAQQVCQLKLGESIDDAWKQLGNSVEFHT